MPPAYADRHFWDTRFAREECFEWLGDGRAALVPPLAAHLRARVGPPGHGHNDGSRRPPPPPRVLHIGAGTSTLADALVEACEAYAGGDRDAAWVVNVDYAEAAVRRGRERERGRARESGRGSESGDENRGKEGEEGSSGRGRGRVCWEQADMLRWADVGRLGGGGGGGAGGCGDGRFDAVVDKSTADAISCGEDVVFRLDSCSDHGHGSGSGAHPLIDALLRAHEGGVALETEGRSEKGLALPPLELLALHLAALVRPGGAWLALSYSSDRFPFLSPPSAAAGGREGACQQEEDEREGEGKSRWTPARWWTVESATAVDAPSGMRRAGVHAPPVRHWVYVLRRSDVGV